MTPSSPSPFKRQVFTWLMIVLVATLAIRIALFILYPVQTYNDTGAYKRNAEFIQNGLALFDGTRAPGYPAFIVLMGSDINIYIGQLTLGVLSSLVIFGISLKFSGKPALAGIVALLHSLHPAVFFFEAALLTEALCVTLLTFYLGAFIWALSSTSRWKWLLWVLVSLLAAAAALVRPLYLFLPFWTAFYVFFTRPDATHRFNWKPLFPILLPSLIVLGAWMGYVNQRLGVFSVHTMSGFNFINTVSNFIELAPDSEASIRDTYIKFRDEEIARVGHSENAIWLAMDELRQATNLSLPRLSDKMASLSIQLILAHPDLYLKNVMGSWWLFWRSAVYWRPEVFTSPAVQSAFSAYIIVARVATTGVVILFIPASIASLIWKRTRRIIFQQPLLSFILFTTWVTSILQALPDLGNPRFLVPMQSWVFLWFIGLGWLLWKDWKTLKTTLSGNVNEEPA